MLKHHNGEYETAYIFLQKDTISYIPCLRVAMAEVGWDCFCVSKSAASGTQMQWKAASAVPPSNKECDDFSGLLQFLGVVWE